MQALIHANETAENVEPDSSDAGRILPGLVTLFCNSFPATAGRMLDRSIVLLSCCLLSATDADKLGDIATHGTYDLADAECWDWPPFVDIDAVNCS